LEYHGKPAAGFELDVQIDYHQPFNASDHAAWEAEYRAKVHRLVWESKPLKREEQESLIEADLHPTSLAHDDWLDERQRQWEEELAWEEYLFSRGEEAYDHSYE
jgi:hypothetical protein